MTDETRLTLLDRVKDHQNHVAWREFDAIYRPMIRRFSRSRGLSEADSEDVVQHAMTAIQRHLSNAEHDPAKGRFRSWVRTVVNNRVRDLMRRRREHQPATGEFERVKESGDSPDDAFDQFWRRQHLQHCLDEVRGEVNNESFKAFHAYVLKERSAEDVCEELGLTRNNLYKIKWRITQRIEEKMKNLLGEDDWVAK